MRVLYVAQKYDYGQPERGLGFEHYNFYESLVNLGHEVLYFDLGTWTAQLGRRRMNRKLLETVHRTQPDLMFTVLWEGTLDHKTVWTISHKTDTVTLNWFCDDHWRFDSFSRRWAPCFNWVVTTSTDAMYRYADAGITNVIKSQWGCNHHRYQKLDLPMKHDVSFVGLPHGNRRKIIHELFRAGIEVNTWGAGWPNGRISQDGMIRLFNQSRINLNFVESSAASNESTIARWLRRGVFQPARALPGGWRIEKCARAIGLARKPVKTPLIRQIKGRTFEVPPCGLLMTGVAENLNDYYIPGEQIVTFDDTDDLIDKVRYYLAREDERASIAEAGRQRTLAEHTYEHRLDEMFRQMQLPVADIAAQRAA